MIGWIAFSALLIGLGGLAYAWKLQQELSVVTRRLDRYNRALFDANEEVRSLRETLTATASELRVAIKRKASGPLFEPSMSIREIQLLHPQAQQVMAGLHLGGCNSCAVDPDISLAQACTEQGVDLTLILQNLNLLVGAGAQNGGSVHPVKVPNVELNF